MNDAPRPAGYEQCGGKTRGGGTCKLPAGHGTSHPGIGRCDHHGGATPNHRAHAQRLQAEAACAKFGIAIETTAAEALTAELHRTAGVVAWLMAEVAALDEQIVWGMERRSVRTNPGQGAQAGVPQVEVVQSARPHPYVSWLERERRHLAAVAADMLRIGLEERMVRVTEQQGLQLARVVKGILDDLHLTPEQQAQVPHVVPARIRELSA